MQLTTIIVINIKTIATIYKQKFQKKQSFKYFRSVNYIGHYIQWRRRGTP